MKNYYTKQELADYANVKIDRIELDLRESRLFCSIEFTGKLLAYRESNHDDGLNIYGGTVTVTGKTARRALCATVQIAKEGVIGTQLRPGRVFEIQNYTEVCRDDGCIDIVNTELFQRGDNGDGYKFDAIQYEGKPISDERVFFTEEQAEAYLEHVRLQRLTAKEYVSHYRKLKKEPEIALALRTEYKMENADICDLLWPGKYNDNQTGAKKTAITRLIKEL